MSKFRSYEIPLLSWHSKDLYRDVVRSWTGLNALYLMILLTLCWIPNLMSLQSNVGAIVTQRVKPFLQEVPRFGFSKGQFWIDGEQYREFKDRSGKVVAIVDTTGKVSSLEGSAAPVLITKDFILVREGGREQKRKFDSLPDSTVLSSQSAALADFISGELIWYLGPFIIVFSFLFRFLQVVILAGVGQIVCSMSHTEIPFPALVRLSVVAITPAILIRTLTSIGGFHIPFQSILLFVLTMGYLVFGVYASEVSSPGGEGRSKAQW